MKLKSLLHSYNTAYHKKYGIYTIHTSNCSKAGGEESGEEGRTGREKRGEGEEKADRPVRYHTVPYQTQDHREARGKSKAKPPRHHKYLNLRNNFA